MLDTSLDAIRTTEVRRALHQHTRAVRNGTRKTAAAYERAILAAERTVVQEVINAYRAWVRGKAESGPSEPAPLAAAAKPCGDCNGHGDYRTSPDGAPGAPCDTCDGHGFFMVNAHGPQEMKCETCGGAGVLVPPTTGAGL